jgi:hypothetical protein
LRDVIEVDPERDIVAIRGQVAHTSVGRDVLLRSSASVASSLWRFTVSPTHAPPVSRSLHKLYVRHALP